MLHARRARFCPSTAKSMRFCRGPFTQEKVREQFDMVQIGVSRNMVQEMDDQQWLDRMMPFSFGL